MGEAVMVAPPNWPWTDSQVCLITGSTRGLGRAVADALVAAGGTVLVSAKDPDAALAAAGEITGPGLARGLGLPLDVTDAAAVRRAVETVEADHGRLDLLVNNAAA
jgi:NAD(P)-dependent dehydrogenase (short-subunit alcohol dehydrogenase family)